MCRGRRYRPPPGGWLRDSSRLIVEGLRQRRAAIARVDSPGRAAKSDFLPLREAQAAALEVTTPPGPHPTRRDQPAGALLPIVPRLGRGSVMNSPRCIPAQDICTTSGAIRSENAVKPHLSPLSRG